MSEEVRILERKERKEKEKFQRDDGSFKIKPE